MFCVTILPVMEYNIIERLLNKTSCCKKVKKVCNIYTLNQYILIEIVINPFNSSTK